MTLPPDFAGRWGANVDIVRLPTFEVLSEGFAHLHDADVVVDVRHLQQDYPESMRDPYYELSPFYLYDEAEIELPLKQKKRWVRSVMEAVASLAIPDSGARFALGQLKGGSVDTIGRRANSVKPLPPPVTRLTRFMFEQKSSRFRYNDGWITPAAATIRVLAPLYLSHIKRFPDLIEDLRDKLSKGKKLVIVDYTRVLSPSMRVPKFCASVLAYYLLTDSLEGWADVREQDDMVDTMLPDVRGIFVYASLYKEAGFDDEATRILRKGRRAIENFRVRKRGLRGRSGRRIVRASNKKRRTEAKRLDEREERARRRAARWEKKKPSTPSQVP